MFKVSKLQILLIVLVVGVVIFGFFQMSEGFRAGMPAVQCGLGTQGCPNSQSCMNGFCGSSSQPALPRNQLPVYP